ncbi:MAG: tRNA pseudouridine(55) synthase TruB, partial [Gammaproteobacteria bacterium]|nr:tRNA pseudouridine(55) synthase TruB [Gammaproteobacteria bacterium]
MKHITLKPGKEKPFLHGEPLIFSGAIAHVANRPAAAELVAVYSAKERFIGVGTFNPH